jgi:hypothetical protein
MFIIKFRVRARALQIIVGIQFREGIVENRLHAEREPAARHERATLAMPDDVCAAEL